MLVGTGVTLVSSSVCTPAPASVKTGGVKQQGMVSLLTAQLFFQLAFGEEALPRFFGGCFSIVPLASLWPPRSKFLVFLPFLPGHA